MFFAEFSLTPVSEQWGRVLALTSSINHIYTYSHGMDVSVGRFALGHLYGCDAQGPDVSHTVVANLLDHLWGHPERSANHSVSLCHGVLQRSKSVKDYTLHVKGIFTLLLLVQTLKQLL